MTAGYRRRGEYHVTVCW